MSRTAGDHGGDLTSPRASRNASSVRSDSDLPCASRNARSSQDHPAVPCAPRNARSVRSDPAVPSAPRNARRPQDDPAVLCAPRNARRPQNDPKAPLTTVARVQPHPLQWHFLQETFGLIREKQGPDVPLNVPLCCSIENLSAACLHKFFLLQQKDHAQPAGRITEVCCTHSFLL